MAIGTRRAGQQSPLRSPVAAAKQMGSFNRIYVGADNGKLYAVFETSATTSVTQWEIQTGAALRTALALSPLYPSPLDQFVYVGGTDGKLYCLNALTGALLTAPIDLASGPLTSPLVDGWGNIIVVVSKRSPLILRPVVRYSSDVMGTPVAGWHPGIPHRGGEWQRTGDCWQYSVRLLTYGTQTLSQSFGHPLADLPPAADLTGTAYVASTDGWLFAVDSASGTVKWSILVNNQALPNLDQSLWTVEGASMCPAATTCST